MGFGRRSKRQERNCYSKFLPVKDRYMSNGFKCLQTQVGRYPRSFPLAKPTLSSSKIYSTTKNKETLLWILIVINISLQRPFNFLVTFLLGTEYKCVLCEENLLYRNHDFYSSNWGKYRKVKYFIFLVYSFWNKVLQSPE